MKTPIDWFYDKIKSHFEHDGDLLETLTFTYAIAKDKEREQTKPCNHNPVKLPYLEWHAWAESKTKRGAKQKQCRKCGLWLFKCEIKK